MSSSANVIQMNVWIESHLPAKQCENEKAPAQSLFLSAKGVCGVCHCENNVRQVCGNNNNCR